MRKGLGVAGAGLVVVVALFALLHEAPATAVAASGGAVPSTSGVPSTGAGGDDSESGAVGDRAVTSHPRRPRSSTRDADADDVDAPPASSNPALTGAHVPPRGTASSTPARGLVMRDDEASRSPGAVEQNALSRAAIQSAIKTVTPKIKACYEQALKIEPTLAGTVKVNFTLESGDDGKGVVTEGEIADSETKSPFFEACVLKEVAGAKFDAPEGRGTVTVTYPFKFAAE